MPPHTSSHMRSKHQSISNVISQARIEADDHAHPSLPNLTMPTELKDVYNRGQRLEEGAIDIRATAAEGRGVAHTADHEIF